MLYQLSGDSNIMKNLKYANKKNNWLIYFKPGK